MNFEFQNVVLHILKFFSYVEGFTKNAIKIMFIAHLLYLLYIIFFDEKW
jgi:hypothetical protein